MTTSSDLPSGMGPPRDSLVGVVIDGRYRLVRLIGAGGMGSVYLAEQILLGRQVALKLLHARRSEAEGDSEEARKRFLTEASALARLQHPNIVTVFDFGAVDLGPDHDGMRCYTVMEYLSGETLARRLQRVGQLSLQGTMLLAESIARGLREAHRQGIVHRDLKPANVMLVPSSDGGETVKLLDFGIAKFLGEGTSEVTSKGHFIGSPMYMAPEQIRSEPADARSDIYALGVLIYRCLAGTTPFPQGPALSVMMAHLNREPAPLEQYAPQVPGAVVGWIAQLMAKEIDLRPSNMDEVLTFVRYGGDTTASRAGALASEEWFPRAASERPGESFSPSFARRVRLDGHTTTRGLAATPPIERRRNVRRYVAIGAGLCFVLGLALLSFGRRSTDGDRLGATSSSGPNAPPWVSSVGRRPGALSGAEPADSEVEVLQPVPTYVYLTIGSDPAADVFEGDRLLGRTPVTITVTQASVANGPRSFVLRRTGYRAHSVVQGWSTNSVKTFVKLEPEWTRPTPSTRQESSGARRGDPVISPTSTSSLDIELTR